MKSKKEIEQLAKIIVPTPMEGISYVDVRYGFIQGYSQCQEDMALSQPKELPHLQKPVESDAVSFVGESTITNYYPIALSSKAYNKLLAIQTKPDTKYWFKDKEVSIEELINILETA